MQALIRTTCTGIIAAAVCLAFGIGIAHYAMIRERGESNREQMQRTNRLAAKREARLRQLESTVAAMEADRAPCDLQGFVFQPVSR